MALQYTLLFPHGERGFQVGIPYINVDPTENRSKKRVSMTDFYRYQFHYRKNRYNPYLCCGRLSMQIRVDARACLMLTLF